MRIIFLFIFTLLSFVCFGQKIRFYNSEQGLSSCSINRLSQDDKGYIWVTTSNGTCEFDGTKFTVFRHDDSDTTSISSDLAKVVFTDSRGGVWVGTGDGLQLYDRDKNIFRNLPTRKHSLTNSVYISSIVETNDHKYILVSSSGVGLIVYNLEDYTINESLVNALNISNNLRFPGLLFIDSQNILWTFSEQGVFLRIDLENLTFEQPIWADNLKSLSKNFVISAMDEDPLTHNIIIGTYNDGLFIFDRKLGYIRRPYGETNYKNRIRALLAEKIVGSSQELQIWVGSEDCGLQLFDRMSESTQQTDFQYTPIDIDHCKVHALLQDNQGNVWAGINQKGIIIVPRMANRFDYLKLSNTRGSMSANIACATAIVTDADSNIWVGCDGGGLFRFDKNGNRKQFSSENVNLPNNAIMASVIDKHDNLWISTYTGGITKYDKQSGFSLYSNSLELKRTQLLYYDEPNDKLYFGTLGYGVWVLSIADNKLERINSIYGWITSINIDSDGLLWVGRTEGLTCYNPKTNQEENLSVIKRFNNEKIYATIEDKNYNQYWFASQTGLYCWHKDSGKFEHYTTNDGLPSNMLVSAEMDSNHCLWIGTGNGLSKFDIDTKKFYNFYVSDGLQDNEFQNRSSFKSNDGRIFFGGVNGVTAFYPDNIYIQEDLTSPLYFSQLSVLNEIIDYGKKFANQTILDSHISQAKHITLDSEHNAFTLDFGVLEYVNPTNISYAYKLEGFDNEWHYTKSNNQSATYTNLQWGNYRFVVKAFRNGCVDERKAIVKSIDIRILPPLYLSWWAFIIYACIIVLMIRLLYFFIKRRKKHRAELIELDKKEAKLMLFTDMSHEIRTPLSLVVSPLRSMRENESDATRRDMLDLMYRNVQRVLRLLNQLIDIRKFDNNQLKMSFEQTEMFAFLQDIMKSFDQLAIMRNIDLRIISNLTALDVWIDKENFDKVVFNILSNAFKFTPDNGTVMITLDTPDNKNVELTIENSGSHIEDSELEHIFERFYQCKNSKTTSGSGIGLHLSKMIVEAHYGTIVAQNVENGVAFIIRLPLGNAHLAQNEMQNVNANIPFNRDEENDFVDMPFTIDDNEIATRGKMRTIVFIDDDVEWVNFIKKSLSDKFNVEICSDSSEAFHHIQTTLPDAIVTDLIMPDVDGLDICKRVRQSPELSHLPIIILTSDNDEDTEQKCISAGADNFLTKPISVNLLKTTIAHAISTREMLRNKYRADAKSDYDAVQMSSPDSRLITKVIEAIRNHIEDCNFGVDELSREVGISRVHLNRKLKETLNTSPSNLIKSIRLKQAAYLLINNKLNVSDVAYKLGYSSHSYFSNTFREYFGLTPTEFVNKYQDENKENINKLFNFDDDNIEQTT